MSRVTFEGSRISMYYTLNQNKVPVCSEFPSAPVRIRRSVLNKREVVTTFLSVRYGTDEQGWPVLFETMVFAEGRGEFHCHYSTWDDALEGHKHVLNSVSLGLTPDPPTSVDVRPQTEVEMLRQIAEMVRYRAREKEQP